MRLPVTVRALTTAGPLRRVLAGYLLYGLLEMSIWLAIILWAYDKGGAELAGLVAVVQLLPAAVIAPPIAGLGDRFNRGTALMLAHLGVAVTTTATTVLLLLGAPTVAVVVASAAATTALSVVRPLHFAALPQLVHGPDDLVSGNALSSMVDGVALFLGPLLAGAGAHLAGPWLVFSVASVVALGATALCLRLGLTAPAGGSGPDADRPGWRTALGGVGALARDRAVVVLLLVLTTKFVVEGAHDVLGVSLAVDALDIGSTGAGLVVGAMGFGGLLGGGVAAAVVRRKALAPVVLGSGLAQGAGMALVAVTLVLAPVTVLLVVAGMGGAVLMVAGRTLLQRNADDRMLARVFAVQEATSLLGLALGAAVAPFLIDLTSPQGAFVPFGVGVVVVTAGGYLVIRALDDRAVVPARESALLRRVGFLSVLPAYELERLSRNATWIEVGAGRDVVREGEPGDLFYVVDSGELRVAVGDVVRPAALGPGDSFGEIALLRSVPRTATVTAATPCRLLTLRSQDFLAAVTGSPSGTTIAAEVATSHLARDGRPGPAVKDA
jgi:MFS family permease